MTMYTPLINTLDIQDLLNIEIALAHTILNFKKEDNPNLPAFEETFKKVMEIESRIILDT